MSSKNLNNSENPETAQLEQQVQGFRDRAKDWLDRDFLGNTAALVRETGIPRYIWDGFFKEENPTAPTTPYIIQLLVWNPPKAVYLLTGVSPPETNLEPAANLKPPPESADVPYRPESDNGPREEDVMSLISDNIKNITARLNTIDANLKKVEGQLEVIEEGCMFAREKEGLQGLIREVIKAMREEEN